MKSVNKSRPEPSLWGSPSWHLVVAYNTCNTHNSSGMRKELDGLSSQFGLNLRNECTQIKMYEPTSMLDCKILHSRIVYRSFRDTNLFS